MGLILYIKGLRGRDFLVFLNMTPIGRENSKPIQQESREYNLREPEQSLYNGATLPSDKR